MAKNVVDLKPPKPRTDLAAEIAPKLEAARAHRDELEKQATEAALADALGESGAAGRLAQLNSQIDIARRDVNQLEAAHRLAAHRDATARAAAEAKARQDQLGILQGHAEARFAAMVELCAGLEVAAKAYARFLDETKQFAIAWPTGISPYTVPWLDLTTLVDGRAFPAPVAAVVASEMFRHTPPGGKELPGAKPLIELFRLQPAAIEPATEAVRRTNDFLIGEIKDRFEAMERATAQRLSKSA